MARPRRSPATSGRSCALDRPGGAVELVAEVLDLVPELRRVLEPQLLGRGEHLLLELDDQLLELLRRANLLVSAGPPARRARDLGLEREELADIGDALLHRLGRDAVLAVVGELDLAPALRLADRRPHRGGLRV